MLYKRRDPGNKNKKRQQTKKEPGSFEINKSKTTTKISMKHVSLSLSLI
jgi:hypothetical protein